MSPTMLVEVLHLHSVMVNHAVIDGSNLATEGRKTPSLAQLREAVAAFRALQPSTALTVVVDATFPNRIPRKERDEYEKAVDAGEMITPPAGAIGRGDAFILEIVARSGWRRRVQRLLPGVPRAVRVAARLGWTPDRRQAGAPRGLDLRGPRRGQGPDQPAQRAGGEGGEGHRGQAGQGGLPSRRPPRRPHGGDAGRAGGDEGPGRLGRGASGPHQAGEVATEDGALGPAGRAGRPHSRCDGAGRRHPPRRCARLLPTGPNWRRRRPIPPPSRRRRPPVGRRRSARVARSGAERSEPAGRDRGRSDRRPGRSDQSDRGRSDQNDRGSFVAFVADHLPGSLVEGTVDRFSSHGAYVTVGDVQCYLPLRSMGRPAPTRARDVVSVGEVHEFVVDRIRSELNGVDLAIPGFETESVSDAERATSDRTGRRCRHPIGCPSRSRNP